MFTLIASGVLIASLLSIGAGIWSAGSVVVDGTTVPDPGIFDTIVQLIVDICLGTEDHNVAFYAVGLFKYLIFFDFFISVIMGLLAFESGPNFITVFANKMFKYGFWAFVIVNWRELMTRIASSFSTIGLFSDVRSDIMMHPSYFVTLGINYSKSYWDFCSSSEVFELSLSFVFSWIIGIIAALMMFVAFFIIALNILVTTIEFYICSTLMLIFVPLAVFEKTERFASQAFSLVVSAGTRLMVMGFIASFAAGLFDNGTAVTSLFVYKEKPSPYNACFCLALVSTIAYLAVEAPQLASSIVSGGLNLSSGSAWRQASSAASGVASASGFASNLGAAAVGSGYSGSAAYKAASDPGNAAYKSTTAGRIGATAAGVLKGAATGVTEGVVGNHEEAKRVFKAAKNPAKAWEAREQDQ